MNWRGKTITSVLKCSKSDVKAFRSMPHQITFAFLKEWKWFKDWGIGSTDEILWLRQIYTGALIELRKYLDIKTVRRYIEKQYNRKHPEGGPTWRQ